MPTPAQTPSAIPETIQGLITYGAEQWPERPFIHYEDGSAWTRRQCLDEAQTAAKK